MQWMLAVGSSGWVGSVRTVKSWLLPPTAHHSPMAAVMPHFLIAFIVFFMDVVVWRSVSRHKETFFS